MLVVLLGIVVFAIIIVWQPLALPLFSALFTATAAGVRPEFTAIVEITLLVAPSITEMESEMLVT